MSKKLFLTALIYGLLLIQALAQDYIYVSAKRLNFRESPSTDAQILTTLNQYDNLILLAKTGDWIKARNGQIEGYVHSDHVKYGKAKVTVITGGRIGAVCKDGWVSSATGRGACSHHGGVAYWKYSERKSVEIIPNTRSN